jgi:serine O-acetyltransferase
MINAVALYRIAHQLWRWKIPLLPSLIKLLIFLMYNSSVPFECEIGTGSFLAYGGIGVVIHRRARIGKNVNIGTGVVIGGRSGSKEVPRIGDNVFLATGCKILGDIEIGDYVVVGPNTVLTQSIPSNSVVAGNPARVLRRDITPEEYGSLV